MECRYFLKIGNAEEALMPFTDLKNWGEIEYRIKRTDFSGLVRSFSSAFEFLGRTAQELTKEFMTNGLYSSATIRVQGKQNDWTFMDLFFCPLDFSSFECEDNMVRINAMDNSLSAYIKANKGKKYEYNMSTDFGLPAESAEPLGLQDDLLRPKRENKKFLYSSIELDSVVMYEIGCAVDGEFYRKMSFIDNTNYQKITLELRSEDILNAKGLEWSEQSAEAVTLLTEEELQKKGADPSVPKFPYGLQTNAENRIMHNINDVFGGKVQLDIRAEFDVELGNSDKPEDFDFYVCTANGLDDIGCTYNVGSRNGKNVSIKFVPQQIDANKRRYRYILSNRQMALNNSSLLMVVVNIKQTPDKIRGKSLKVLSNTFNIRWKTRESPNYIDYVTPYQLLQKLVESMTEKSAVQYKCQIAYSNQSVKIGEFGRLGDDSSSEWRLPHVILVPQDAVTRNPDKSRFIRTSFNDYCRWMESCFGYLWRIENIEGYETIVFRHRSDITDRGFGSGKRYKDYFTEVNDVKYKASKKFNYSSVEVGFDTKNEDNDNYRYEFNKKVFYDTGILNTEKKLSLVSPYRADCIGFEIAYHEGVGKTQDDKNTHDGIWCVYAPVGTDDIRRVDDLKVSGQDYVHYGLFNYYLSPVFCLKANSRILSRFARQLLFESSPVNNFILDVLDWGHLKGLGLKVDWVSQKDSSGEEISPFHFFKGNFGIGEITFKTNYVFPSDYDESPTIEWQGKTYRGMILDIKNKFERIEGSECTMLEYEIKDI